MPLIITDQHRESADLILRSLAHIEANDPAPYEAKIYLISKLLAKRDYDAAWDAVEREFRVAERCWDEGWQSESPDNPYRDPERCSCP